jgi:hypothetical protein
VDRVFKQPMASPVAEGLRFTSSGGRTGPHPDGPGSDVVNGNCLSCHSAGMVLTQPALSPMQWRTEVEKMRTAYKAPIDAKDIDTIVNYLVALQPAR